MKAIRVCTLGLGRTGKEVAAQILTQPDMTLAFAVGSNNNPHAGQDLSAALGGNSVGVAIHPAAELEQQLKRSPVDVAVDFSTPEAAAENAEILARHNVRIVIATTGFTDTLLARLHSIARHYRTGIVYAPNITLGVNVMMLLANLATALLENYDCTIVETHFKEKKDAPSGTAVKMAEELERGMKKHRPYAPNPEIPIHALRIGGVVGRHSVLLAGANDQIQITHESFSRKAFVEGALKAMRFVVGAQGFFEMKDVLDLEEVLRHYLNENGMTRHKVLTMPSLTQLDEAGNLL